MSDSIKTNMLSIALIGYGQMGKMIENLAPDYNCRIVRIIDPNYDDYSLEINEDSLFNADVCLDFSLPECVVANAESVSKAGKNLVIGTTGWFDNLSNVEGIVRSYDNGMIYASNFSVGMNLFFSIAEVCSRYIAETGLYDTYGFEKHHNKKVDSPSGTAKDLAEILVRTFPEKKRTVFDRLERQIEKDEVHFASVRGGSVPGTHCLGFDSVFDNIELIHTARNREGFAVGALKAAQWIHEKKGCFNFSDIFVDVLLRNKS